MALGNLDYLIIGVFFVLLASTALFVKRFNRSVSDFLVANRCAGRYMMTVGQSMGAISLAGVIGFFQLYYNGGFSAQWWQTMGFVSTFFIAASGWVFYRYRETRCLTVGQFIELRYSKGLRTFYGCLSWVSGLIVIGIFPAVAANFFIKFFQLPETFTLFGLTLRTFTALITVELLIALTFTFMGGMLVVLVTDAFQGLFSTTVLVVVILFLFMYFKWDDLMAFNMASDTVGRINPFESGGTKDFTIAYFLMMMFLDSYMRGSYQSNEGYTASAKSPHEAKMSGLIAIWRAQMIFWGFMLVAQFAYFFLNSDACALQSAGVQESLALIADETLRNQVQVPMFLSSVLPVGLLGLFAAAMLGFMITTDDTVLHAWGSLLVQDVIMPLRKKHLSPKAHMLLLRVSILLVAIIMFVYSYFYKQNDYIFMYISMGVAIVTSGFGVAVICGLYTRFGSVLGGWMSALTGSTLCISGLVVRTTWPKIAPVVAGWFPSFEMDMETFPFNGTQIAFFACLVSIAMYAIGSLISRFALKKKPFNLEKMLHRGTYRKGEEVDLPETGLKAILPGRNFTKGDKVIYGLVMISVFGSLAMFLTGLIGHWIWDIPAKTWSNYWMFVALVTVVGGGVTAIWITVGGVCDFRYLLKTLGSKERNEFDDGRVVGHSNEEDVEHSV
ncbi:MAG: hypothetical protein ABFR33_07875 [Verrucomicrobiota bacterium]